MPEHWRFRTNWRGKLVLQREVYWMEVDAFGGSYPAFSWRDATATDMMDFFKELV